LVGWRARLVGARLRLLASPLSLGLAAALVPALGLGLPWLGPFALGPSHLSRRDAPGGPSASGPGHVR